MSIVLDYLALRYMPGVPDLALAPYISPGATITSVGKQLYRIGEPEPIGFMSQKNGATTIDMPGSWWRHPNATSEARAIHAWAIDLHRVVDIYATVTVPRIDYVWQTAIPPGLSDQDILNREWALAGQLRWNVTTGTDTLITGTGITHAVGPAGRDVVHSYGSLRRRSPFVRIYWERGSPYIRVEAELKGEGTHALSLDQQLDNYDAQASELLAWFAANEPLHLAAQVDPIGTANHKRHADGSETFARIVGSFLGYTARNGIYVPPSGYDALTHLGWLLGARPGKTWLKMHAHHAAQSAALERGDALNSATTEERYQLPGVTWVDCNCPIGQLQHVKHLRWMHEKTCPEYKPDPEET